MRAILVAVKWHKSFGGFVSNFRNSLIVTDASFHITVLSTLAQLCNRAIIHAIYNAYMRVAEIRNFRKLQDEGQSLIRADHRILRGVRN
jgi:hypothetical protein